MKKTIIFSLLSFAVNTVSAQYVHIKLSDGSRYDIDSRTIESMTVDNNATVTPDTPGGTEMPPAVKVEGQVTIGGVTYTRTVGGTVGIAVDLGLPSGTLWADRNVGASSPKEYGAYIMWGEVGAKEEKYVNGMKENYGWPAYKYSPDGSWGGLTKYTCPDNQTAGMWYSNGRFVGDGKTVLESVDDAATVNWGKDWVMPTIVQIEELNNSAYTTWYWTTKDGVSGYEVRSRKNGNSIFLPASGYHLADMFVLEGIRGFYWSSSLNKGYSDDARYLNLSADGRRMDYDVERCNGFSVRPVRAKE